MGDEAVGASKFKEARRGLDTCPLDKTLQPHAAYLYPAVEIAYRGHSIWVTTTMKKHPIQGGVARVSVASCYRNGLRGKLF